MLKSFTIFSLSLFFFLLSLKSNNTLGRQQRWWWWWWWWGGGGGVMGLCPLPSLFRAAERKKGNKGKKERVLKQKLLNGCHQGQNVTVLVSLDRL